MILSFLKNRIFAALFALAWFWVWAYHIATGLFDSLMAGPGIRRSFLLGTLQDITAALLVVPLGKPVSVLVLILIGIVSAAATLKFKKDK